MCVYVFISTVASLVSPFMGVVSLNNIRKHIWLRKLVGFVWEAGTQVVELYLQSSVNVTS